MTKRKSLPSVGKIFDYWKDKYEITGFCFVDWGEPSCPSCGNQIHNIEFEDPEKHQQYLKQGKFETIWNTCIGLERHHIIPHSLGGSDKVDNLFLLCHECHGQAPMTNNSDAFFKWLKTPKEHNYWRKFMKKGQEIKQFIELNYSEEQKKKIYEIEPLLNKEDICNFLDTKINSISLHFNEKGAYIPDMTLVYLIIEGILSGELKATWTSDKSYTFISSGS